MRYGKVTALQVARMAGRADKAGQVGLALHLFCLAAILDEADPLALPRVVLETDEVMRGHAILGAEPQLARSGEAGPTPRPGFSGPGPALPD